MVAFGKTPTEDSYNSFFLDSNKQVELACDLLSSDEMLANGFNAMGFSQGSQFLRALVQRCGSVKIYNLISLGGQHNGVYGFPFCPGSSSILCHLFRRFLGMGTYLSFIQDNLVQAQYWHDPYDEESYALDCEFLSDINQELVFKPSYKERFSNISNFVLVKFEYDMMVEPKETEWFGFYKEHQSVKTYSMFESKIYRRDLIGLQYLNKTERI
ncbi:PREDICTED: palmitoyl-protein thioesterase 1-like, partial [Amphimedon queenslandica]|uniref:Palmitoyl-protein thioesterase 1 n=1 Tax=Amphimedon queenslandica TaxID=400682 RepID=A0AAN0JVX5_AMPQE